MHHFVQDLESITSEILELATTVEGSVRDALRALEERRLELTRKVIDGDAAIDAEEVRIEDKCIRILVIWTPVAGDLRRVIAVLKINDELERIGDLAVNIAEEARSLAVSPRAATVPQALRAIGERALRMLQDSLNAFVGSDAALAWTVVSMDDEIDHLNREVRHEIETRLRTQREPVDSAFSLVSVARHLERITDHATNIAEHVIHRSGGEIIRHDGDHLPEAGDVA